MLAARRPAGLLCSRLIRLKATAKRANSTSTPDSTPQQSEPKVCKDMEYYVQFPCTNEHKLQANISKSTDEAQAKPPPKKKTQAELDEELRLKMSGLAGDGGDSGVEYEDGQPASMKRSVKNNMFRYI